jgi:alkaline phosphatase D
MKKIILTFLCFLLVKGFSQNKTIVAGPMVGYCEMKEAMIWIQTNKNIPIKIAYFSQDDPKKVFFSETYNSSKASGYTYHILLDELQPGKKYNYSVYANNTKVNLPYETSFSSKKLWQYREDAPDFKVSFGSCSYIAEPEVDRPGKPYGSGYSIFESINKTNPDIMIWGGDNIYLREVDYDNTTGIYQRYSHTRSIKEMQPLLAKTQNYAIWDDHDYGPNDSDRSYYLKHVTQKAFKDFWANKTFGMDVNQQEGIFTTFSWSDTQFFLLDDRYFRSPNDRITGEKRMLGKDQLEWLIDALVSSKASFKIIVVGGQVINESPNTENFAAFPEEKSTLLKEIAANKIKGVLFLSGDRHFTELSMLPREQNYPLYDWTVSPLTSGTSSKEYANKNKNNYQIESSDFYEHNFGNLEFSGSKENRQVKLILYSANGTPLWDKVILKRELQ